MTACTETEAAEKWCPFMRNNCAVTTCIGSRCMQWRWMDDGKESLLEIDKPSGEGWETKGASYWERQMPQDKRRGYCGLAGKP